MTDLAPPSVGLRRIGNRSKSPIRTEVVVPMGDELEVSEALAEQLVAAGLTADPVDDPAEEPEQPAKPRRRTAKKAQG